MDNLQLIKFFSVANISQIKWAHRINDWQALKTACFDNAVHFIEGDISISKDGQIIMAHPPAKTSNLLFADWVKEIIKTSKGLKLDFKDPNAVLSCLKTLQTLQINNPVVLNADVLIGPGANQSLFSAKNFIKQCQANYPKGILSIGWTTKCVENKKYTQKMVNEMLNVISNYPGHITFSIRMCYVEKSFTNLKELISLPDRSFTLWNNEKVSTQTLKWIESNLDPQQYFFDLVEY